MLLANDSVARDSATSAFFRDLGADTPAPLEVRPAARFAKAVGEPAA